MSAIALYKGISPFSRMIRWFNFSDYRHASFVDDETGTEWEAMPGGVHEVPFGTAHTEGTEVDLFALPLTPQERVDLLAFFSGEKGCPYDWSAIGGFVTRRNKENPDAWFCSELVCAGLLKINKVVLARIEPFQTYPGLISYSPALKFVKTVRTTKKDQPCTTIWQLSPSPA
jgi:hypothetical protein